MNVKTFEEYLPRQTRIEMGSRMKPNISRDEMIAWCKELDIKIKSKTTKDEMMDAIMKTGKDYMDFYNRFKNQAYGIHPIDFTKKFGISKYEREKMYKLNFITIMYSKYEKVFTATYGNVPYYNSEEFFRLTKEDMDKWVSENVRSRRDRDKFKLED